MDKIYVILVNYKQYENTIECVESLLKSVYKNFQIFIIDNSPDDISASELITWFNGTSNYVIKTAFERLVLPTELKPVKHIIINEAEICNQIFRENIVIVRSENHGFAAANNIVLNYMLNSADKSSYAWILNNDTVVEADTMLNLLNFYEHGSNHKKMLGAKLLYYSEPDLIQAVVGKYNKLTGASYHLGEGEKDNGQYNEYVTSEDDYIVGASIFFPKRFIKDVGLMSEDYFLYFEDLDWSTMAKKIGYELGIQPTAKIYHKEGGTNKLINGAKVNNDMGGYYTLVNRVKFTRKWYKEYMFTVGLGVIYGIVKRILQGKFKLVINACYAIYHSEKIVRYKG
jgi:GT2 family glycosyltransferase